METGMIENVAKALAPLAWAALNTGDSLAHKNRRTASLRHARTAIEAMRAPTAAMIAEMDSQATFGIGKAVDDEAVIRVWRGGIDAALAEEGKA